MKILVIDDNQKHLDAARAQLATHELTVVASYDGAMQAMLRVDHLHENVSGAHQFDAVLVDLLMPASAACQGKGMQYAGQEMPVGIFLALLAARHGVARYVGLLTDTNHHAHPASSCLDAFNAREKQPTPFMVGNTKVVLTNNREWIGLYKKTDLATVVDRDDYYDAVKDHPEREDDYVTAKSWGALLACLLQE